MQSFGVFINENKLTITLILLAGILGVAILIFLYRLLFGRRLHMAGNSRARQPRLGVVDAFDLDRQRQLVLVRRDNVEHLIMIGGPNDLVIESAFVRVQPNLTLPIGRDKEGGAGPLAPMAPMPASATPALAADPAAAGFAPGQFVPSAPGAPVVAATGRDRAIPPLDLGEPLPQIESEPLESIPAPAPVTMPATMPDIVELTSPEPAPPPPPTPAADPEVPPPRPVPMPSRFPSSLPPRPAAASTLPPRPPLPARTPVQASALPPRPTTLGPRPMPSAPLSRGTSAASLRRDPPQPAATPSGPVAAPEITPGEPKPIEHGPTNAKPLDLKQPLDPRQPLDLKQPVDAPPPQAQPMAPVGPANGPPGPAGGKFGANAPARATATLPTTLDTLESLEEEMARLLGRSATGLDKG
jgi:hypothetical protein